MLLWLPYNFVIELRHKTNRLRYWRRALLSFFRMLYPYGFMFKDRGEVAVKGKGVMETYFLIGTSDRSVAQPDDQFDDLPVVSHANPIHREKVKMTWRSHKPVQTIHFLDLKKKPLFWKLHEPQSVPSDSACDPSSNPAGSHQPYQKLSTSGRKGESGDGSTDRKTNSVSRIMSALRHSGSKVNPTHSALCVSQDGGSACQKASAIIFDKPEDVSPPKRRMSCCSLL